MLADSVLKNFSRFISVSTKLFLIPSIWNPQTRTFKQASNEHKVLGKVICLFDILFRTWCFVGYGYMISQYLNDSSTMPGLVVPIMYLCCLSWCVIPRYISYAYQYEIEQFLVSLMSLNAYLRK